jgi:hypothetical protein
MAYGDGTEIPMAATLSPTTRRDRSDEPVTEPKTQRERKDAVNAIKLARGCEDSRCMGYPPVAMVLSFDHLDPSTEDFKISAAVLKLNKQRVSNIRPRWTYPKVTWLELLDEIAKCDVVCLNCHAIRTAERGRQVIGRAEYGCRRTPRRGGSTTRRVLDR